MWLYFLKKNKETHVYEGLNKQDTNSKTLKGFHSQFLHEKGQEMAWCTHPAKVLEKGFDTVGHLFTTQTTNYRGGGRVSKSFIMKDLKTDGA